VTAVPSPTLGAALGYESPFAQAPILRCPAGLPFVIDSARGKWNFIYTFKYIYQFYI